jgi:hypothetical protein
LWIPTYVFVLGLEQPIWLAAHSRARNFRNLNASVLTKR